MLNPIKADNTQELTKGKEHVNLERDKTFWCKERTDLNDSHRCSYFVSPVTNDRVGDYHSIKQHLQCHQVWHNFSSASNEI